MAKYYSNWQEQPFHCRECGWTGKGAECPQGEIYQGLVGYDCPQCAEEIFIVELPTVREMQEHEAQLSDTEKMQVEAMELFGQDFAARSLKSSDQLPDLEGDSLVLTWDVEDRQRGGDVLITHEAHLVWREPALYEGYKRFEEIAQILKAKYRERLQDLVPTSKSELYLYGDDLFASSFVEEVRAKLPTTIIDNM